MIRFKINLLPEGPSKKKEKIVNQLILGFLVIVAVMGGLGFRYYMIKDSIDKTQKDIKDTKEAIQKLSNVKTKLEQQANTIKLLETQRKAIEDLGSKAARKRFLRVLDKISESAPRDKVWIQSLRYEGNSIVMSGFGSDKESVAKFMGELTVHPCGEPPGKDGIPSESSESAICKDFVKKCEKSALKVRFDADQKRLETVRDYDACRGFYQEAASKVKTVCAAVKSAERDKDSNCKDAKARKSEGCTAAKEALEKAKQECAEAQKNEALLHIQEYIKYQSVEMKELTRGAIPGTKRIGYKFTLEAKEKSSGQSGE